MALNHQHLRAFHAVALDGSISRAARRLGVSQPTLSQQVRSLEQRHNLTLFENRKTPLQLTPAGRDLFLLTRKLFAVSGEIEDMLSDTVDAEAGRLRLGSDSPTYAARLVSRFAAEHPNCRINVRMGNAAEVVNWLRDAQIDAAIGSDPPTDETFSYQALYRDELQAAVPVGSPLATAETLPLDALASETLLLREGPSRTRRSTEQLLETAGIVPLRKIELHTRDAIREAIAIGLGVSLFYSAECPPDSRLVYLPVRSSAPKPFFNGYLVCLSERRRAPIMRALFSSAAELAKESPLPL